VNFKHVGYYKLQGGIFEWIMNLPQLEVLDLSNNKLSGRIPSKLGRLKGFQTLRSSQLSGDTLYEEVKVDIKGVEYPLTYVLLKKIIFYLSINNLIGEIPPSMGSLSAL